MASIVLPSERIVMGPLRISQSSFDGYVLCMMGWTRGGSGETDRGAGRGMPTRAPPAAPAPAFTRAPPAAPAPAPSSLLAPALAKCPCALRTLCLTTAGPGESARAPAPDGSDTFLDLERSLDWILSYTPGTRFLVFSALALCLSQSTDGNPAFMFASHGTGRIRISSPYG